MIVNSQNKIRLFSIIQNLIILCAAHITAVEGTRGTETSKYPKEEKLN